MRMCACRGAAGFAHVSCLTRQAKILVAEAEERDLDDEAVQARWDRWNTCRLCEQRYHGVVMCALGWACWKTYVGRPEEHWARRMAMNQLANGLFAVCRHGDALSVNGPSCLLRRLGNSERNISPVRACVVVWRAGTREALSMERDVYLVFET